MQAAVCYPLKADSMSFYAVLSLVLGALGMYVVITSIINMKRLDSDAADYSANRKKELRRLLGGVLIIGLALWRYYSRVYIWGW